MCTARLARRSVPARRTRPHSPTWTQGGPNAEVPHARSRGGDAGARDERLLAGWERELAEQASASETPASPTSASARPASTRRPWSAEMYAQALEAKGYTVERHLEIGERPAVHAAMDAGDVNLIPEYLGGLAGQLTGIRRAVERPAGGVGRHCRSRWPPRAGSHSTSRRAPMPTASPSGRRPPPISASRR